MVRSGIIFAILVGICLGAFAAPTEDELAFVKKYDGLTLSTDGLVTVQGGGNGNPRYLRYYWNDGSAILTIDRVAFLKQLSFKDGTRVIRDPHSTTYYFLDGRSCISNSDSGKQSWNLVGDPAPDFDLSTLDGGSKIKLSSLKGSVVLLDFFASWCEPCQTTLPDTEKLWQKSKDQGLKVIGIDTDDKVAKGLADAQSLNLTFPCLSDEPGLIGKAYKVPSIPRAVLVDKEGTIRWDGTLIDPKVLATYLNN